MTWPEFWMMYEQGAIFLLSLLVLAALVAVLIGLVERWF